MTTNFPNSIKLKKRRLNENSNNGFFDCKIMNEQINVLGYLKECYEIKIQLKKINDEGFIVLSAKKEGSNSDFIYETILYKGSEELKFDSIPYEPYDNTKKVFFFLLDSFIEKKIIIQNVDETNLILVISSNESFPSELKLKRKNVNIVDTVEMLNIKIKELEKENKKLKFRLDNNIFENEDEQKFIKDRLLKIPGYENKIITFKLMYRLSYNGSNTVNFHKVCDNIPNNLTLVKTSDYERFGGYTELPWISSPHCIIDFKKCFIDNHSFCFSLSKKKIYDTTMDSIISCDNNGPNFIKYFRIGDSNSLDTGYLNVYGRNFKSDITNYKDSFTVLEFEFYQVLFE
ncbi:hypothetical protein PIROE2DRAFT_58426 [Piromyces sp. E2]|nr:hypothetical protein PIROE2DRAFT_58426 [Piromyces sp. E2]|eukprot:OUM67927.1 hypothetical protein PIROE2DRAFT_58426 [Piromyces sp. E2]